MTSMDLQHLIKEELVQDLEAILSPEVALVQAASLVGLEEVLGQISILKTSSKALLEDDGVVGELGIHLRQRRS